MTPAVERLVRPMVMLPGHHHPLWNSLVADRGDGDDDWAEATAMRWFVGQAAKIWPPAGPV